MTRVLIRSNQPAGKGGDERREQTRDDEDKGQVARGKRRGLVASKRSLPAVQGRNSPFFSRRTRLSRPPVFAIGPRIAVKRPDRPRRFDGTDSQIPIVPGGIPATGRSSIRIRPL